MDSLTKLYCLIDDFCRVFEPAWERHLLAMGAKRRQRPSLLSLAEWMTLAILVPSVALPPVQEFLPGLCLPPSAPEFSNCRVINAKWSCCPAGALFDSLKSQRDGTAIADATALAVCDNKRILRPRSSKGVPSG
jgi:hypothetical protein